MVKIYGKVKILISNFIILMISLVIPKSKKYLLFGSWFGKSFSDNSKYLYLYCNENKDELGLKKIIWVTDNLEVMNELKSKGLMVAKKGSISSAWYHLRSKYHFIDQSPNDIDCKLSVRSERIQLWHGVGFKDISVYKEKPNTNIMKYKMKYYIKLLISPGFWYKYTFFSTSNFASKNIFNLSFRLWENKVIEGNYPRNIFLLQKEKETYLDKRQEKFIDLIKHIKGKKIILYMPTYRQNANIDKEKELEKFLNAEQKEIEDFSAYLNNNEYVFLVKSHFAGKENQIFNNKNLVNIPSDMDVYPILEYTDMLITDYSSIYADYLFLDKPIVFYPYDLEEYMNLDKGFLFDYNKVTPGDKAFDISQLKFLITKNFGMDSYEVERKNIKNMYFGQNINDKFNDVLKKIIGGI